MRTNDKVLLENINDYFSHKGMAPNLIDDIKENLRTDLKKSETKDQDYLEYRGKSPAQIILIIQRNLFGLQLNPVIFFIMNFILISYLYDKQYVPFQAATAISIFYCIVILPITIFINIRIDRKKYLYSNRFEIIIGYGVAVIALILIIMRAFYFTWGIVPITIYSHQFVFFVGIIFSLTGLFIKKIEYTGIGLLFCQKTIDAVLTKPEIAQIASLIIWILIVVLVVFYTVRLSSRTKI
ncbi:hypothetical protein E2556_06440 [Staphylococcus croceilyticus]|uniref:DUF1129 domain-containing protein n=1 Tax=Staphylococcus croceilyticus TaxID=319942 RepID=A0ABY2KCL0_9STAP|nr:hypothetical protein [Staphylococcus croceilyticus]PNZ67080.1 hypothetical protein CD128_08965 [Staphylococcus croceilyticus]TGA79366.1 hypothetical protein E2556_06440 [Staphylococcus croceilyticus]